MGDQSRTLFNASVYEEDPMVSVRITLIGEALLFAEGRVGEAELPDESTVQTLLEQIPTVFGSAVGERILNRDGTLVPTYVVFVNGREIGMHHHADTVLPSGQITVELMKTMAT